MGLAVPAALLALCLIAGGCAERGAPPAPDMKAAQAPLAQGGAAVAPAGGASLAVTVGTAPADVASAGAASFAVASVDVASVAAAPGIALPGVVEAPRAPSSVQQEQGRAARWSALTFKPGMLLDAEGNALSVADVVQRVRGVDYVLVGEVHNIACDHRMQAALLRLLVDAGIRPAIGLEMLTRDRQPALDGFAAGRTPLADLPAAVEWQATWGYDFALYQPVFEVVQSAGLPVYGLNVPQHVVRQVRTGGLDAVAEEDRQWLPPVLIGPSPVQRKALEDVFREHMTMRAAKAQAPAASAPGTPSAPGAGNTPGVSNKPGAPGAPGTENGVGAVNTPGAGGEADAAKPAASLTGVGSAPASTPVPAPMPAPAPAPTPMQGAAAERFLLVQSLWDSAMGYEAVRVKVRHGGPVYILAGGGHVENGWGIARRIAAFDPQARVLLVMPWRGGDAPDPGAADMFFACRPAPPRLGLSLAVENGVVRVAGVVPGSHAERAGFRSGDVIEKAMGKVVESASVLHEAGKTAFETGADLPFVVLRDGVAKNLVVTGFGPVR